MRRTLEFLYIQRLFEHLFIESFGKFFHELRIHLADGRHVVVKTIHQYLSVRAAHGIQRPGQPPDGVFYPGAVHGMDIGTTGAAPLTALDFQLKIHHAFITQQDFGLVVLIFARTGQEDTIGMR